MYHIHGLNISSNTTKTVYVAEELGVDYRYTNLDMPKGEHKTPEHMARHPLGKAPTFTHGKVTLFESATICRYMALTENSDMYPATDSLARCKIDQWMDFFTNHVGRWLNSYAFEKVAKVKFDFGTPDKAAEDKAKGFIEQQMPAVDQQLANQKYIASDQLTIADSFAFAYMERAEFSSLPLDSYPGVQSWYQKFQLCKSVVRAKKNIGMA